MVCNSSQIILSFDLIITEVHLELIYLFFFFLHVETFENT